MHNSNPQIQRIHVTLNLFSTRLNSYQAKRFAMLLDSACDLMLAAECERLRVLLQKYDTHKRAGHIALHDDVNLVELRDSFDSDEAFIKWVKNNK